MKHAYKISPTIAWQKQIRFKDLPKCSECGISDYCVRCAGIALGETGDMLKDFQFACEIAQISSMK